MGACHLCRWRNVAYAGPQRSYRVGHAEVHSTGIRFGIPDYHVFCSWNMYRYTPQTYCYH
jgi:hypothetical protein